MKNFFKFLFLCFKSDIARFKLRFYNPKNDVVGKKLKEIFKKNFKVYHKFLHCFIGLLVIPNIPQIIIKLFLTEIEFNCKFCSNLFNIVLPLLFNIGLSFLFTLFICKQMQKIIDASKNSFSISKSTTDKGMLIAAITDGLEKLVGVHKVIKLRKKKNKKRQLKNSQ